MSKYRVTHGSLKLAPDQLAKVGEVVEVDDEFAKHVGGLEKVQPAPKADPTKSTPKTPEVKP